mmetsp:Transcript_2673/g.6435  ORF Transcript_2673/g.6435 Transcript_2673/m.6435 type:complete len:736 (-) Transcript_2673:309-2516(-)|eukprot:CAMPEP_0174231380 /NCGR_PEP_ID=MMETSP0417-20130205/1920_1 /TAXON_ID=242541 /ORGANISM="Mayorella sp, Strain BSH-02190019" /LENGTH=735 /DNA_ID=CAMNT_0015309255 /DNA_START=196 /DNA_END=2403 /DNA_ORIENTATION=-
MASASSLARLVDGLASVFEDPISFDVLQDAVVAKCGHSFSKDSLNEWFRRNPQRPSCPLCKSELHPETDLVSDTTMNQAVNQYLSLRQTLLEQRSLPVRSDTEYKKFYDALADGLTEGVRSGAFLEQAHEAMRDFVSGKLGSEAHKAYFQYTGLPLLCLTILKRTYSKPESIHHCTGFLCDTMKIFVNVLAQAEPINPPTPVFLVLSKLLSARMVFYRPGPWDDPATPATSFIDVCRMHLSTITSANAADPFPGLEYFPEPTKPCAWTHVLVLNAFARAGGFQALLRWVSSSRTLLTLKSILRLVLQASMILLPAAAKLVLANFPTLIFERLLQFASTPQDQVTSIQQQTYRKVSRISLSIMRLHLSSGTIKSKMLRFNIEIQLCRLGLVATAASKLSASKRLLQRLDRVQTDDANALQALLTLAAEGTVMRRLYPGSDKHLTLEERHQLLSMKVRIIQRLAQLGLCLEGDLHFLIRRALACVDPKSRSLMYKAVFVGCRGTRKVSASLLEYLSSQLVQIPVSRAQDVDVGALKQCARWTAHFETTSPTTLSLLQHLWSIFDEQVERSVRSMALSSLLEIVLDGHAHPHSWRTAWFTWLLDLTASDEHLASCVLFFEAYLCSDLAGKKLRFEELAYLEKQFHFVDVLAAGLSKHRGNTPVLASLSPSELEVERLLTDGALQLVQLIQKKEIHLSGESCTLLADFFEEPFSEMTATQKKSLGAVGRQLRERKATAR